MQKYVERRSILDTNSVMLNLRFKHPTILTILLINSFVITQAQVINTGMTDRPDSIENGKFNIKGYVDIYYGYDFNEPAGSDRQYAVSSSRHNEVNINLAYADLRYQNDHVRARFTPGFGTYMNANYNNEKGTLRNLIEANVGVRLSSKREIWVDAGVLGSPFTNETAISKDHFMYLRSLAPEYVPYYLSGVRLTCPFGPKLTTYFYLINGWQQISDENTPLSFASQIEYKPNQKVLLNWDTYVGNEKTHLRPIQGNRYFSDVYAIINPEGRLSTTICLYGGIQEIKDTVLNKSTYQTWWQGNIIGRLKLNAKSNIAARVEYFEDSKGVVSEVPVVGVNGLNTYSVGLCYNKKITENALFRMEGRHFFSDHNVFINSHNTPTNVESLLVTNLTVWF